MTKDKLHAGWNEIAIKYDAFILRSEKGVYSMAFTRVLSLDEMEALLADVKAIQDIEMRAHNDQG